MKLWRYLLVKKVVVIGGNAAGLSAASQVKRRRPEWEVTVLEKGTDISYGSCGIPYFLGGLVPSVDQLTTVTPEKAVNKRNLNLLTAAEATALDPQKKEVVVKTDCGSERLPFDFLAFCAGASATTSEIEVEGRQGIFTVHNLNDAREVDEFMRRHNPRKAAVIGGGFIAVELVEAFQRRGLETHLVHRRDSLARHLEQEISDSLLAEIEKKGVILQLNRKVKGVSAENGTLAPEVIVHTEAEDLHYDMVVIATGVKPNTAMLEGTGIELGRKNAVKADAFMQTNYEGIYAAGDCAQTFNLVTGEPVFFPMALKANREGFIAGVNIAGGQE